MIELIDPSKTYELSHPSGSVFVMRHWTVAMQDELERRIVAAGREDQSKLTASLERSIKVDLAVADWRGVSMNGADAPCSPENKKLLPVGVQIWVERDIDDRSGTRITDAEKKI